MNRFEIGATSLFLLALSAGIIFVLCFERGRLERVHTGDPNITLDTAYTYTKEDSIRHADAMRPTELPSKLTPENERKLRLYRIILLIEQVDSMESDRIGLQNY